MRRRRHSFRGWRSHHLFRPIVVRDPRFSLRFNSFVRPNRPTSARFSPDFCSLSADRALFHVVEARPREGRIGAEALPCPAPVSSISGSSGSDQPSALRSVPVQRLGGEAAAFTIGTAAADDDRWTRSGPSGAVLAGHRHDRDYMLSISSTMSPGRIDADLLRVTPD